MNKEEREGGGKVRKESERMRKRVLFPEMTYYVSGGTLNPTQSVGSKMVRLPQKKIPVSSCNVHMVRFCDNRIKVTRGIFHNFYDYIISVNPSRC